MREKIAAGMASLRAGHGRAGCRADVLAIGCSPTVISCQSPNSPPISRTQNYPAVNVRRRELTREKSGAGLYACCCTSSRTTSLPTKATRILLSAWIGPPGDVGVWRATVAMIFEYSNEYLSNSTRIVSCPPEVLELYRSRQPSKTDNTPLLFSSPQNFCLPYMSVKPGRSQHRCKHKNAHKLLA